MRKLSFEVNTLCTQDEGLLKLRDNLDAIDTLTEDQKERTFCEILRVLSNLTMDVCGVIYNVVPENVKNFAPRSAICFWLHEHLDVIEMIIAVGMVLSKKRGTVIPNAILRAHDICYRYKKIIQTPMNEYYENLETVTYERLAEKN